LAEFEAEPQPCFLFRPLIINGRWCHATRAVLTDNGMAFADLPRNRNGPTRPYHPWTNGQAERTRRTVKDATIETSHHPGR